MLSLSCLAEFFSVKRQTNLPPLFSIWQLAASSRRYAAAFSASSDWTASIELYSDDINHRLVATGCVRSV